MSKYTGGPAFPLSAIDARGKRVEGGMTLRDYFAAKALSCRLDWGDENAPFDEVAQDCYNMADAMLAERAK